MAITFLSGDILDTHQNDLARGLAFSADCAGHMNEGMASALKKRWPELEAAYAKHCHGGKMQLGDVFAFAHGGGTFYALGLQKAGTPTKFAAFERAMNTVLEHAKANNVQGILLPRVGTGKQGLDWTRAKKFLSEIATGNPIQLVVFEKFVRTPSTKASAPTPEA
jgi:O-acetyl-ADP-ribose deacetylase (regulator of RNase III)